MNIVEIMEDIAIQWNRDGIDYAVLNGLDNYPDSFGRDLDILVRPRDVSRLINIAADAFKQNKYQIAYPPQTWGRRIVAFKGSVGIEIHTMVALEWFFFTLYDQPNATHKRGVFKIDPCGSFVKKIVQPLMAKNYAKVAASTVDCQFRDELPIFFKNVLSIDQPPIINHLVVLIFSPDINDLILARAKLVKILINKTSTTHFRKFLFSLYRCVQKKVNRLRYKSGITVAFVGPDGVGKSSVVHAIIQNNQSVFTSHPVRHWRPGLLPELAAIIPWKRHKSKTSTVLPRRNSGNFYHLRLLYYYADFVLGYFLKDKWLIGRQSLILYDRTFLDMKVDPLRYGLSSTRGIDLLWRYVPKPDLIILLQDQPKRIYARKPELSVDEITRQLDSWQHYLRIGAVHEALETSCPPDKLADKIMESVHREFLRQHSVSR